ncbi:hypothetical protein V8C44DRAFT_353266 [Trichoderma aethiopicum]
MRDNGQKKNGKKRGRTWRADRARYQPACHHTCTVHTCTGTSACDRAASLRRIFPCSSVGQLAMPVNSSRNMQQQVVDNSTPRVSNWLLPYWQYFVLGQGTHWPGVPLPRRHHDGHSGF